LRASICAVALHFGCPTGRFVSGSIADFIIKILHESSPYVEVSSFFSYAEFNKHVISISGAQSVPCEEDIQSYIESILLPHCLRMAVYGNGPTTRFTRVSKGTFETAQGLTLYPEPFGPPQTPLPDPLCSAAEHSMEAVLSACAIIRRVRLLRATQYAVSGALSLEKLNEITSSHILRQSMEDLPLWWNPQIHDLALLVYVATGGLFSLFLTREGTVFDSKGVVKDQVEAIAKQLLGSQDDIHEFVKVECSKFPSPNILERRLALLCAEATKFLDNETRYDHLPMFDHGGWPRN
jgi:hypothetical protein